LAIARRPEIVLAMALVGIIIGLALWLFGWPAAASAAWAATTVIALLPLTWSIVRDLRHGEFGVDLIALLAMAGSLALGQELAGAVIAVMLSGGDTLEGFAGRRARRELAALVARAPQAVHRYEDGQLASQPLEEVRRGDVLLVKPGEVVPVDGVVSKGTAVLDEAALTGEARPVERLAGDQVHSGVVNAGPPFDMFATATAESSTYARIVRLVQEAQVSKAPFVRMADRYALWFLPLTIGSAGLAWLVSGSPVRALAVVIVATPCPLILAAPVAIMAGISRAAGRGVIVKGGVALEALAQARTVVFDKTGTLTAGTPRLATVEAFGDWQPADVLRLAASLDQLSPHVFAAPIVVGARERGLSLEFPTEVEEVAGAGIHGRVGPTRVALGKASWLAGGDPVPQRVARLRQRAEYEGTTAVFVAVDGKFAGALTLEDPVRPDAPRVVRELRRIGVERVVVLSGDREEIAEAVGTLVGADLVLSEHSPEAKVEAVHRESRRAPTAMIGDGINDAPALAAAQVGVAMGARGATAASEAADAVIIVDRLERVVDAMSISRRAVAIARQSVVAGMALSGAAMVVAAVGWLPPVAGAIFQEAIDVAVILNALRALGVRPRPRATQVELEAYERVRREHHQLRPLLTGLRQLADAVGEMPSALKRAELRGLHRQLVEQLLPHEAAEGSTFYPLVARAMGGGDPTGVMLREHAEISSYARDIGRLADQPRQLTKGQLTDLRRSLYGLYAVLRLHMAQEDEEYLALFEEGIARPLEPAIRPPSNGPIGNGHGATVGLKLD
jgi:heavy metal translocating P-type ATPase